MEGVLYYLFINLVFFFFHILIWFLKTPTPINRRTIAITGISSDVALVVIVFVGSLLPLHVFVSVNACN